MSKFSIETSSKVGPYNQGPIGSCTANAFCYVIKLLAIQNPSLTQWVDYNPSRLYIYWCERYLEANKVENKIQDTGANVIDACLWAKSNGICAETDWPYDVLKVNKNPTKSLTPTILEKLKNNCSQHKISGYTQIYYKSPDVLTLIKSSLANNNPVMIGFLAFPGLESISAGATGLVPNPTSSSQKPIGGHEVVLIGFDEDKKLFTFMNSWGVNWGNKGKGYLTYDYVKKYGLDYITINL